MLTLLKFIYRRWTQSCNSTEARAQNKMEVQPTEILELIFHQFSTVMDLRKCFNTCERWREIVENLFKDRGISNHFKKNKNTN